MTNHMEAAIEAGAREVSRIEPNLYKIPHAPNRYYSSLAADVITAALPHLRAMVAEEIVSQHQDYVCTNYENPGDDDHPRACVWEIIENITHQLTGTNQITDNAAQIAEGNRP